MSQAAVQKNSFFNMNFIHSCIGIAIIVLGPFFQSPEFSFPATPKLIEMGFLQVGDNVLIPMSDAGWTASIIFLGLLYLWIFVDTLWPSLFGMVAITFSPHFKVAQIIPAYLGNSTTFMILFLLFIIAALIKSQVVNYLARFFLTRKFTQGRPWLLITTLIFATYACSLITSTGAVLMMWSVVYFILNEAGYKPGDRFSTFMVGNTVACMILGLLTDLIKGPILFMLSGYSNFVVANPDAGLSAINVPKFMLLGFVLSLVLIALILFSMRFIFRLNVEPLRTFDIEKLNANPLPPMNWKQKTTIALFLAYALLMLIPSSFPSLPGMAYLNARSNMWGFMFFFFFVTIRHKGEQLVKLNELTAILQWGLFFLLATVFYFSTILTKADTNIPILMQTSLSNALQGLDYIPFLMLTLLFGFIATNLTNSIVTAVIMAPIIATIAVSYGFPPMPIVIAFILIVATAILTPAAGVPGAFLYGNKEWLPGKEASFYAIFFSILMTLVIIFVGVPLANILF